MSPPEDRPTPLDAPARPRMIDLAGLVVGFAAAALLMRSLWPSTRELSASVGAVAALLHLWLGTAMAGPVLLLLDRRGLGDATRQLSWPQTAWLLIGSYWLALTALVVPRWLSIPPYLGVLPVAAALLLRFLGRRTPLPTMNSRSWTDRVAVALLMTWPLAWGAMILLGKTLF